MRLFTPSKPIDPKVLVTAETYLQRGDFVKAASMAQDYHKQAIDSLQDGKYQKAAGSFYISREIIKKAAEKGVPSKDRSLYVPLVLASDMLASTLNTEGYRRLRAAVHSATTAARYAAQGRQGTPGNAVPGSLMSTLESNNPDHKHTGSRVEDASKKVLSGKLDPNELVLTGYVAETAFNNSADDAGRELALDTAVLIDRVQGIRDKLEAGAKRPKFSPAPA